MKGASHLPRVLARVGGSIRGHIAALVAIQLVLVAALVAVTSINDFRRAEVNAGTDVRSAAMLSADALEADLADARATFDQLPEFAYFFASPTICDFVNGDSGDTGAEDRGVTSRFLILRTDGTEHCPSQDPRSFAAEAWFRKAVATGEIVEAGPLQRSGTHIMVVAALVPDHDFVVATELDLGSAADVLARENRAGLLPTSYTLTAANGTVFSGQGADAETIAETVDVPALDAELTASVTHADATAAARGQLGRLLVVAGAMALLALGAAIVVSRRFARPLRSLATATHRITAGETDAKVTPRGPTEVVELGKGFNEMVNVRNAADDKMRSALEAERRAAEQLREADQMRTAFLMAISHELRTPLTTVVGYAELLEATVADASRDDIEESVGHIASQSKRLQRLLLDLLDVERLSRGVVEPNLVTTEVRRAVMNALEDLPTNGHVRVQIKTPVHAVVDPALVERIVQNLVINAVKHTPAGTNIWVRASRRNGLVRLVVEDDGPGIPDNRKEAIFETFEQNDTPDHAPGTGVGLTLVRQFARLHGGRAWVTDRRGGGASFRVELPASPSPATTNGFTVAAKAKSNGSAGSHNRTRPARKPTNARTNGAKRRTVRSRS